MIFVCQNENALPLVGRALVVFQGGDFIGKADFCKARFACLFGSLWLRGGSIAVLLLVSIIFSVTVGAVSVSLQDIMEKCMNFSMGHLDKETTILFSIRLPRILFAAVAGASLALVGLLMQTISQNHLADPYILGVSSGASMGAVFVIVSGMAPFLGGFMIYVGAFCGAALATILVVRFTGESGGSTRLVLMGAGIAAFFSALTMLFVYGAKDEAQVRSAMFWLLGSLTGMQWNALPMAVLVLIALLVYLFVRRHDLDLVLLGRNEAHHLGFSTGRFQRSVVLVSSVSVAVIVALSGMIGFVGLVIPHIARVIGETRHAVSIWFTALLGALALVWADVLSRTLFRPEEVPIGILTAVCGAPVFLWIIGKHDRGR